jgi:hypothetical protein
MNGRTNGSPIRKRQSAGDLEPLNLTPRQINQNTSNKKDSIPELVGVPYTSFIPGGTGGIFGIGHLAPRTNIPQNYPPASVTPKNTPLFTKPSTSRYFFIIYNNPSIAASVEGILKSFAVIETLSDTTEKSCSEMLRLHYSNITAITKDQYNTGTFYHPKYIGTDNQPLPIRYAEIPIIKQKTPGRLDDIPLGYPDFDNTPSGITTRQGPVPTPPYTNFTYVSSPPEYVSSPGATSSGSVIYVSSTTGLTSGMYIYISNKGVGSLDPSTKVTGIINNKTFSISPSPITQLSGNGNVITGILPITIVPGGTVAFIDTSVSSPWQFAPTGWAWDFGITASPTGSTGRNPIVSYGTTGTYTVSLTASNASGFKTKIKTNFVVVTN